MIDRIVAPGTFYQPGSDAICGVWDNNELKEQLPMSHAAGDAWHGADGLNNASLIRPTSPPLSPRDRNRVALYGACCCDHIRDLRMNLVSYMHDATDTVVNEASKASCFARCSIPCSRTSSASSSSATSMYNRFVERRRSVPSGGESPTTHLCGAISIPCDGVALVRWCYTLA